MYDKGLIFKLYKKNSYTSIKKDVQPKRKLEQTGAYSS